MRRRVELEIGLASHLASIREALVDGVVDISSHLTRSLLQLVGVVLGVGSVVTTLGLIDGGRQQVTRFFDETGGVRKMMIRNKEARGLAQGAAERKSEGLTYGDARALLAESRYLELVEPTLERSETVRAPGFERSLEVSGITSAYEPMYRFHPAEGRFVSAEDLARSSRVVVLGAKRRQEIFGSGRAVGQPLRIGNAFYTVVGVMERKEFSFNEADGNALEWMNELILVPVTTVLNRMAGERESQKVAYLNVQVRDLKDMDAALDEVRTILLRHHGGVEDFEVTSRKAQMERMDEQGAIFDVTFIVCGAISLLVGGIVIMNILLASFNERIREVGTRKALGATGWHILAQVLVESVLVTILGGLLGLLAGVGFTHLVSSLIQQPVTLSPGQMLTGLLFAVTVGLVFGIYPAVKAARLDPIQALRYE